MALTCPRMHSMSIPISTVVSLMNASRSCLSLSWNSLMTSFLLPRIFFPRRFPRRVELVRHCRMESRGVHAEANVLCVWLDEIPAIGDEVHHVIEGLLAFLWLFALTLQCCCVECFSVRCKTKSPLQFIKQSHNVFIELDLVGDRLSTFGKNYGFQDRSEIFPTLGIKEITVHASWA